MSLKRLDLEDITVSVESTTTSAWSGNVPVLETFFTGSTQVNSTSGQFYFQIFDKEAEISGSEGVNPPNPEAEVQFAISYGNISGSLGTPFTDETGSNQNTPTSVSYKQYRTLILGTEERLFEFGEDAVTSDEIFAVNIDRARYKEKLLPGTFELTLENSNGDILVLRDNSATQKTQIFSDAGREFELIQASSSFGNPLNEGIGSYGKLYPDIGIGIVNAKALRATTASGGLNMSYDPVAGTGDPLPEFYNLISTGSSFKLATEETISSNIVFIRARNSEFNYTTNPSIIDITGEIREATLINSPQTYITTVGLFNDRNELLAVSKLSRPLLKDFTREALIRIKLDF